jgi:hypothetical protein
LRGKTLKKNIFGGKKMADKAMGTMIIVLVIGALIGAGAMYYYDQPKISAAYQQGMAVAPSAVYTPAELDFTWDTSSTFNHAATVNASGDVATDTDVHQDLTIENTDDTNDAVGIIITLTNPKTGASGIDEDLDDALDDVEISIDYGTLTGVTLIKDSVFHDRTLGDIPAGADLELTVHVTLLEHNDGDFPDGASLDCSLYIWQPGADNVDTVDFTITT